MTSEMKDTPSTRPKRILNLLSHIPTFLFRFVRLLSFVVVLLPAFCVFLWHYLMCDRLAVYYGDCKCDKKTGSDNTCTQSKVNESPQCNNGLKSRRCKVCRPLRSRHYLDIYGSNTPAKDEKPVLLFLTGGAYIIGYKMWGTLLARALAKYVLVIVPDYRNYPAVTVEGMVNDIDMSIEWVFNNVDEFGGDAKRIVVVGQSAGAHLGGIIVVQKVLDRLRKLRCMNDMSESTGSNTHYHLKTSYEATDLCGFISTSSPINLVRMKQVFHSHGLSCSVQRSIFGGSERDGLDVNGEDVFEKWSTFHMVMKCQDEYLASADGTKTDLNGVSALKDLFPNLCVIHGTNDKTVPVEESIEFLSRLTSLKIPSKQKFYDGWTHTDPILEAPMRGNHLYHKDVYELVRLWTCNEKTILDESEHKIDGDLNGDGSACVRREDTRLLEDASDMLPHLDDRDPMLRPICPNVLVEIARICNPF